MADGIEYLRGFPDFEQGNVQASVAFGLERVVALLEEVGSPHLMLPVIHLAGTKGKGSTAAMIASVMLAAGYVTGLFTQPHLIRLNERFQIDGSEISDAELGDVMLRTVKPAVERLARRGIQGIQQFEVQVALALTWFAQRQADVVVLETGLGGRLDGTNVVPQPVATVLTPIGYDHMQVLGDTLPQIAAEKAAIIKDGVPVIAAPQVTAVEEVFRQVSMARRAPLLLGGLAWHEELIEMTQASTTCDLFVAREALLAVGVALDRWRDDGLWVKPDGRDDGKAIAAGVRQREGFPGEGGAGAAGELRVGPLFTPLLGAHQAVNAACAALTAIVASRQFPEITLKAIQRGLASVRWPGRLQVLSDVPTIVLDGAHTPESSAALVAAVHDLWPARRMLLVCGLMGDKDIPGFVAPLAGITQQAIATQSAHRRAAPAMRVAEALRDAGVHTVEVVPEPWSALRRAMEMAGPGDLIVATGSLSLVGEILKHWEGTGPGTGSGR